jgi:23S rRNA (pseudouridine1915-N3)-methyltransferase
MKLMIIAVGSLSTPGMQTLHDEYANRLQHYASLNVIELKEGKGSDAQVLQQEARLIEQQLPDNATVVVLSIEGKPFSSTDLSAMIDQHQTYQSTPLVFLIGGSLGLQDSLKAKGTNISLSNMTFPHQLARVLLLEQLYRSFKILKNEVYHK